MAYNNAFFHLGTGVLASELPRYLDLVNCNVLISELEYVTMQRHWYDESSWHTCRLVGPVGYYPNADLWCCWYDKGYCLEVFYYCWPYYHFHILILPGFVTWQIIALRASVEDLVIDDESLAYLGDIGQRASLRFGLIFGFSVCGTHPSKGII